MNQRPDDLHWQAAQYVLGELSPVDAADFEDRLAVDQQAREAVASAVELTAAVAAVADETRPIARRPRRAWEFSRSLGYMCLGAAACLFVMIVVQSVWQHRFANSDAGQLPLAANEQSADADLALAWREVRAEAIEGAEPEMVLASNDVDAGESRSNAGAYLSDDELDVPSWMIEATGPRATP